MSLKIEVDAIKRSSLANTEAVDVPEYVFRPYRLYGIAAWMAVGIGVFCELPCGYY